MLTGRTSTLSAEVRQLQQCQVNYDVLRSGLRRVSEDLQQSYESLTSPTGESCARSTTSSSFGPARIALSSTSASILKFSLHAEQLLIECTLLSSAPRKSRLVLLHNCVSTSLEMLETMVEGFARKNVMPMIEDAHSVAVASTAVRLIRFLAYLDRPARSAVMRKLTRGKFVAQAKLTVSRGGLQGGGKRGSRIPPGLSRQIRARPNGQCPTSIPPTIAYDFAATRHTAVECGARIPRTVVG